MQFKNSTQNVSVVGTVTIQGNVIVIPIDNPVLSYNNTIPVAHTGVINSTGYNSIACTFRPGLTDGGNQYEFYITWYEDSATTIVTAIDDLSCAIGPGASGGFAAVRLAVKGNYWQMTISGIGGSGDTMTIVQSYRTLPKETFQNVVPDVSSSAGTVVVSNNMTKDGSLVNVQVTTLAAETASGALNISSKSGNAIVSVQHIAGPIIIDFIDAVTGERVFSQQYPNETSTSRDSFQFIAPKRCLQINVSNEDTTTINATINVMFVD